MVGKGMNKRLPQPAYRALMILLWTGVAGCTRLGGGTKLELAEQLLRENRHEDAIAAYRAHIENRLAISDRPEWENPQFYLLVIGDVYLGQGDITNALACYDQAAKEGIHPSLISDRYRSTAKWYEDRNQLKEAMEVLKQHRELDTLLFDAMLDRIAKTLTEQENEALRLGVGTSINN